MVKEGRKEMFYLTTHSTHFIYGYMSLDIWLEIMREETYCHHKLLFLISRQDSTHHILCYIGCRALAGTRNGSMTTTRLN